ncbi:MAG: NAD-dependent epimerase/dehydratase family protein [Fusobacteriaceae bacterium]
MWSRGKGGDNFKALPIAINLYDYLSEKYEIVIIDRLKDKEFIKKNTGLKSYIYNFSDVEQLKEILRIEKPNYIVNLISIVTASRDLSLYNDMIKSNLDILLKIYEASKQLESLKLTIQFGSGEEYGNIESPFNEKDKEIPSSPYAIVKLMTTNTSVMLQKNYNYPICVVRPSNLFGNYQDEQKFIPYIVNQLKNNLPVKTSPGEQKRDFVLAKYFSKQIEILLNNFEQCSGEIFNLGSGKSLSLKDIIIFLKKELSSKSEIEFGAFPYRENEMMDFKLDIQKIKRIDNSFEITSIKNQLFEHIEGVEK